MLRTQLMPSPTDTSQRTSLNQCSATHSKMGFDAPPPGNRLFVFSILHVATTIYRESHNHGVDRRIPPGIFAPAEIHR